MIFINAETEYIEETKTVAPCKINSTLENFSSILFVLNSGVALFIVQVDVHIGSVGLSHSSSPTFKLSPQVVLQVEGVPEQVQPTSI